jgi:micrococcal nuclease
MARRSRQRRFSAAAIPLDLFMRRRLWRNPCIAAFTLLLLALMVWADRSGLLLEHDGPGIAYHDKMFTVMRVVDGDTIVIAPPGRTQPTTRVRLWGIDTPEKFRPDPQRPGQYLPPDAFAEQASALATRLCDGKTVRLYVEPQRVYDKYDRLLAYVELPDGTLLNEQLLVAGLATADSRWSHTHMDRFALIERQAKHDGAGMWAHP